MTEESKWLQPASTDLDALRIERPVAAELIGRIQSAENIKDLFDIETEAAEKRDARQIEQSELDSVRQEVERHVLVKISDMALRGDMAAAQVALAETVMLARPHSRVAIRAMEIIENYKGKATRSE